MASFVGKLARFQEFLLITAGTEDIPPHSLYFDGG
jgi:hypothetical protein